jgi:hypothetical protein
MDVQLQSMGFGEAQIHAATQKAAKVGVPESDLWGFMLGVLLGGKGDGTVTEKDNLSACPSNVQGRGKCGCRISGIDHFFAFERMTFGNKYAACRDFFISGSY